MIAYIRGILTEKSPTRVVLEAAGVGYELFIPLSTYDRLPHEGETVKLFAHHSVKEDDETLFGFWSEAEKELFLKLVSVSGVGPKIAIAILSGASIGELSLAIASGDAKRLAAVKGVGRKTAEKICVELKGQVSLLEAKSLAGAVPGAAGKDVSFLRDAVMALNALGFSEEISNKMVTKVMEAEPSVADTETVIRLALKGK